jgi:phage FluMu protein Com
MPEIRCPYCVEGDHFKVMVGHFDGRYICARYGHVVLPDGPNLKCTCPKCRELNRGPSPRG